MQAWFFYLPAALVPLGLYVLWIVFGQSSVLPLDLRSEIGGRRLVGDSRGLWGLPAALLLGALCAVAQSRGADALILSLGADFGCVVNSFIKRRLGIPRGRPFRPWDHIDFVLGASMFYHWQYGLSWSLFTAGVLVWGAIHCLGSLIVRGCLHELEPSTEDKPETSPR